MKKVATQNELYEIIIQKIDVLENRFGTLEEKVVVLDEKFDSLGDKVNVLGDKVDILGERVDQMSGRLYFVEKTTLAIRDDIKGVTSVLHNHEARIGNLELA